MANLGTKCFVCLVAVMLLLPAVGFANPDPCLVVYPDVGTVYHYDPSEYYTVGPGDSLYDPVYDRNGEVLIDINTNGIAYDVYQAPNLTGFVMDADNQGYYTMDHSFNIIVDGFSNTPTTYVNILLVFDRLVPSGCVPVISIDGNAPLYDAGLGWYYPIGDLAVLTPAQGNNYSDTESFAFTWSGCTSIRIWAFADDNYDLNRDGNECFSAYSHDLTVPAQESTWGSVKSIYR